MTLQKSPRQTREAELPLNPVFPVLDTMRMVGAFAVLLTHVGFWAGTYTQNGVAGVLVARADIGVAVFFVLSGFLLSRPWLTARIVGGERPAVRRYLWKRLLRIYPVYALTVVIAMAFVHDNRDRGVGNWLVTLGMLNIYTEPHLPAGLTQMWSLATEVAFYLLLPALMAAMTASRRPDLRTGRVVFGLAVMVAVSVLWHLWLGHAVPRADVRPTLQWLPASLDWFALGIGFALLFELGRTSARDGRVRRALLTLAAQPGVCWSLAAGLFLVSATTLAGPTMLAAPTPAESLTKNLLYGAISALVILPGIFPRPGSDYATAMSHPWSRHLGHISYGLFCLHLPALHFVRWVMDYELFRGNFWPMLGLTLALSLVIAELCYRFLEEPLMRFKNLGRRSSSAPATTPPRATSTQ